MSQTLWKTAVSYEYNIKPPETVRGEFSGGKPQTVAARALKAASKAMPKRSPQSIVVVLERVGPVEDMEGEA